MHTHTHTHTRMNGNALCRVLGHQVVYVRERERERQRLFDDVVCHIFALIDSYSRAFHTLQQHAAFFFFHFYFIAKSPHALIGPLFTRLYRFLLI